MLDLSQLASLKLARYEFRLKARGDLVLLSLLGSTLRGAFGHAWKIVTCAAAPGVRAPCFLAEICQKPEQCQYLFFKPTAPQAESQVGAKLSQGSVGYIPLPYIFQPLVPPLTRQISGEALLKIRIPKGGEFPFKMTLLDQKQNLPNIFSSVALMAQHGLGKHRVPCILEKVSVLDVEDRPSLIYRPLFEVIQPHDDKINSLYDLIEKRLRGLAIRDTLTIRFLTPTRIRRNGVIQRSFTFPDLVEFLLRRVEQLIKVYGTVGLPWDRVALRERAASVSTKRNDLWYHQADRQSTSQDTKLDQGGMLGTITYSGVEIGELLPLIVAGEYLHVGTSTSLGHGMYLIEN